MKFWAYLNGEVPGCFTPEDLVKLDGFSSTALVCPAEGEVLEKNWRRAGEFPEIIPALEELAARQHPAPPPKEPGHLDVDSLLTSASHRLFGHVSELMKELEHHREEKALIVSLQRQVMDLQGQLKEEHERCGKLETGVTRLAELEAAQRAFEDRIQDLESSLQSRDRAMADLRAQSEKTKAELDHAKRNLSETTNDLAIRNRLVEKLNHDLTEKEVSLTKALSLLRQLDADLTAAHPETPEAPPEHVQYPTPGKAELPPALPDATASVEAKPKEGPEIVVRRSAYTTDEPPKLPEAIIPPPPDQPAAHNALVNFLKRVINKPEV